MEDGQRRRYGARPRALPGGARLARPASAQDGRAEMKTGTIGAVLAAGLLGASALAQGADDASEKLRMCSLMGQPERLPCLKKLAEELSPASTSTATPSAA